MSKIVAATNVMLSNSNKISTISNCNNYWFFLYDSKYAWCIKNWEYEGENRYMLCFMKAEGNFHISEARVFERLCRQDVESLVKQGDAIVYKSNEMDTDEAMQAFRLLYTAVKEKGIGIDEVLDDIINE